MVVESMYTTEVGLTVYLCKVGVEMPITEKNL